MWPSYLIPTNSERFHDQGNNTGFIKNDFFLIIEKTCIKDTYSHSKTRQDSFIQRTGHN